MLTDLGCRDKGTCREIGIDTVLGHVRFACSYQTPVPEAKCSRQRKRALEREKAKQRRRKSTNIVRQNEARSAYLLREDLKLNDGMTPGLSAMHNRIAAFSGSFREGAETLQRLTGVIMSESTFMRRAYSAGARAIEEQELAVMRMIVTGELPAEYCLTLTATTPTLYIMMDGTGVPCVKKDTAKSKGKNGTPAKTREIKVGVVGTFRWLDRKGRPVRDRNAETHIASAKTAQEFGSLLRRVANSRGYGKDSFRVQICGDGAEWIENIVKNAFPSTSVIFVNDFYHTCEHLHRFLSYAFKDAKELGKAFRKARGILFRNGGKGLVAHLERFYGAISNSSEEARKELSYFKTRIEYMKYSQYRKEGLYIGSGIVEAACRTDVARRCKQAGMHWRLKNAAAMCALVARLRSGVPAKKIA